MGVEFIARERARERMEEGRKVERENKDYFMLLFVNGLRNIHYTQHATRDSSKTSYDCRTKTKCQKVAPDMRFPWDTP